MHRCVPIIWIPHEARGDVPSLPVGNRLRGDLYGAVAKIRQTNGPKMPSGDLGADRAKVPATCSSPQSSSDRRPFATLLPRLSESIAVVAIHRCLAPVPFAMFAIGWMLAAFPEDGPPFGEPITWAGQLQGVGFGVH
jgi:hypothetical protein